MLLFHRLQSVVSTQVFVSTATKESPKFAKTVATGCATVRHWNNNYGGNSSMEKLTLYLQN